MRGRTLSRDARDGRCLVETSKHSWGQYASLGTSVVPSTEYGGALTP